MREKLKKKICRSPSPSSNNQFTFLAAVLALYRPFRRCAMMFMQQGKEETI